jgi:hypothetical protein
MRSEMLVLVRVRIDVDAPRRTGTLEIPSEGEQKAEGPLYLAASRASIQCHLGAGSDFGALCFEVARRSSFEWTNARTRKPFSKSSFAATLAVAPVAPPMRMAGFLLLISM